MLGGRCAHSWLAPIVLFSQDGPYLHSLTRDPFFDRNHDESIQLRWNMIPPALSFRSIDAFFGPEPLEMSHLVLGLRREKKSMLHSNSELELIVIPLSHSSSDDGTRVPCHDVRNVKATYSNCLS